MFCSSESVVVSVVVSTFVFVESDELAFSAIKYSEKWSVSITAKSPLTVTAKSVFVPSEFILYIIKLSLSYPVGIGILKFNLPVGWTDTLLESNEISYAVNFTLPTILLNPSILD